MTPRTTHPFMPGPPARRAGRRAGRAGPPVTFSPGMWTLSYTAMTSSTTRSQSNSRTRTSAAATKRARRSGSARQLDERARQPCGVLVREQPAGRAVLEHPPEGRQVGCHDGRLGGHGLDEHDAEGLATGVGRHVDVDRPEGTRLVLVADPAQEGHVAQHLGGQQLALLVDVAGSGDEDLRGPGPRRARPAAPRPGPPVPCAARPCGRGRGSPDGSDRLRAAARGTRTRTRGRRSG